MKRLNLLLLIAAFATGTATAADMDWRLRVTKEADGWSVSLSGPMEFGQGRNRIQGSGVRVEKQRALPAFTRLRLEGPVDVRLAQAGSDQAIVVADDNVEPLIETVVEGESLVVRLRRDAGFTMRTMPVVRVDARTLQAVVVSGSGDLAVEQFKADALQIQLMGSGDAWLGLVELKDLRVGVGGSGDIRLAGRAEQQDWTVSGSGDVDARALSGRSARAVLSGSGDVSLGVLEQLDARLSGSGDLSYVGRPQLRQSISGSGEIRRR
ncbi:MAG: head GIN domain-containing protein [Roseateles sp.]